jgi:hypothetical protein
MDHFAGLDVSVKETSVYILDDAGKILKEVKMASEPQALLKVLGNPAHLCTEILNSGVVVMESAKDGARIDDTGPLNPARDRRILFQ